MPEYKEIQILKQVKVQATDGKFAKYNTNCKEDEKYKRNSETPLQCTPFNSRFCYNVEIVTHICIVPLLGNTSAVLQSLKPPNPQ